LATCDYCQVVCNAILPNGAYAVSGDNTGDKAIKLELCVVYIVLDDAIEGKHVAILGCGLVILEIRCEHASCGSY